MKARQPTTALTLLAALGVVTYAADAPAQDASTLFETIDVDGSGGIEVLELRSATADWSFAVDVDDDGEISRDETIRGWEGASAIKAEEILNELDVDDSGEVERDEFVEGAISRMDTVEAERITLFGIVDADGDGVITRQELRTTSGDWSFAVDIDGDGRFSRDEIVYGWEGASATKAEEILNELDVDDDGEVQRHEFAVAPVGRLSAERAALFDRIDADGDGAIQLTELRTSSAEWSFAVDLDDDGVFSRDEVVYGWEGASATKAEAILNELDTDGSGEIEREEFVGPGVARYRS